MNSKTISPIPVIDLFAGPGGLGEGFASFEANNAKPFKIVLSIERDPIAYETLKLRCFFRQFKKEAVPDDYYEYLRGSIKKDELFKRYPEEAKKADQEAWLAELGSETLSREQLNRRIIEALSGSEKWVLIGGPPCQAYSLVGRSRMKNAKPEEFEKDKRHFLYKEYLSIIAIHGPPVFVMENVPGILSSRVNGENIFEKILHDLRNPTDAIQGQDVLGSKPDKKYAYRIYSLVKLVDDAKSLKPADYVIKAENYGIPQARHRVILLGIRSDLDVKPSQLLKAERRFSMWEVISDLPPLRSKLSKQKDSNKSWKSVLNSILHRKWFLDPSFNNDLKKEIDLTLQNIDNSLNVGCRFTAFFGKPALCPKWYHDPRLLGINHHESRGHIRKDLQRYLFASCFAKIYGRSPIMGDFPKSLLPKHGNVKQAVKGDMFTDRFRVQLKGKPATTITAHISKDGHYYIHPDPVQCRSLTVREAARLQTFPDNYFFEGLKTQQYHQIGNAVPPLLAKQISLVVNNIFESPGHVDETEQ